MSRKRYTGRSQYISGQGKQSRQRKQRVTSSPVLDMIAAAGFIIGFFAFIVGKSNEQMIFQYAGKILLGVSAYILPVIIIIRFLMNPEKYGRFTAIREEGPSSSTIALLIISGCMCIAICAGDIEVKAAVICFVIALIIILICSVCFRKRIPENQKIAFYIILQLFLFSWMYEAM